MEGPVRLDQLPPFVMARLLSLEQDARAADSAARDAAAAWQHAQTIRASGSVGNAIAEQLPELFERQRRSEALRQHLAEVVDRVRGWLERLPDGTVLERHEPMLSDEDLADLEVALAETHKRLKAADKEQDKLLALPTASEDIEERVRAYVANLAERARPFVKGIGEGRQLSVRWPPKTDSARSTPGSRENTAWPEERWPEDNANPLLLMALFQPKPLAEVILVEIEREVNAEVPLEQRQRRLAQLEGEIETLERKAAAIAARSGGLKGYGSARADAVLGVVVEKPQRGLAAA
jgi:hypothetical protein